MYKNIFNELDIALKNLGQSDSSIEYAPHMRLPFDDILYCISCLKVETINCDLVKEDDWYFL